jgi:hypothetical protein
LFADYSFVGKASGGASFVIYLTRFFKPRKIKQRSIFFNFDNINLYINSKYYLEDKFLLTFFLFYFFNFN